MGDGLQMCKIQSREQESYDEGTEQEEDNWE